MNGPEVFADAPGAISDIPEEVHWDPGVGLRDHARTATLGGSRELAERLAAHLACGRESSKWRWAMPGHYYVILGVAPGATVDELRAAYRRRVKQVHPDRHGPDRGPFLALQKAHTVLSDPALRAAYDRWLRQGRVAPPSVDIRETPVRSERRAADPPVSPDSPVTLPAISVIRSFRTFTPSFEEIFDRLWSNFTEVSRPKGEQLESLTVDIPVTPDQALRGGVAHVLVPARAVCPHCRGRGYVDVFECWHCTGHGSITGEHPIWVSFPAGISQGHTVVLRLDRLGIRNLYLTVRFRAAGPPVS